MAFEALSHSSCDRRPHRVLVIEDDPIVRDNLCELLEAEGFDTREAGDGARAIEIAGAEPPSVVLCDLWLPVLDGFGVLRELRARRETRAVPFIFLTAATDRTQIRTGMRLGADDYVTKPFARRDVLGAISSRLRMREPPTPPSTPLAAPDVLAVDPRTRALFDLATTAGRSALNVLVRGEAGSGKEVVARHVHRASADGGSLAVVACGAGGGALERSLPRSGTVLLDAIDELRPEAQAELLSAIDERGSAVRFLSTARADLEGTPDRFRRDLLYRLDGFRLDVPPLRDRPADVVPLAEAALARAGGRSLAPCARAALVAHDWRGNVRELESAIERAAVFAGEGGSVLAEHLPTKIAALAKAPPRERAPSTSATPRPNAQSRSWASSLALRGRR